MEKTAKIKTEHCITIHERSSAALTGVSEVMSFSDSEILLKTVCGELTIRGNGLNIGKLNTDTGELAVSGTVSLVKYSKKKNGGIFEGLLK